MDGCRTNAALGLAETAKGEEMKNILPLFILIFLIGCSPENESASKVIEEWRSLEGNANVGVSIYLGDQFGKEHALVGVVTEIQEAHSFPDGSVRKAIHIKNHEGSYAWIPFRTAEVMYAVKI